MWGFLLPVCQLEEQKKAQATYTGLKKKLQKQMFGALAMGSYPYPSKKLASLQETALTQHKTEAFLLVYLQGWFH